MVSEGYLPSACQTILYSRDYIVEEIQTIYWDTNVSGTTFLYKKTFPWKITKFSPKFHIRFLQFYMH